METKNQNPQTRKINEVQNLIILDRSGSMSSIAEHAIAGVNETLGTIRASARDHEDLRQQVTLVSFCGCSVQIHCKNTPAEKVQNLTAADYQPCCSTPLYDTMGVALTEMRKHIGNRDDVAVSVTIITDGYENASRKWTGPQIKALIELLKADGWMFAYIGANQDLETIKFNLSIDNTMSFECNESSVKEMFNKECKARKRWASKLSEPYADPKSLNDDYFSSF